MKYTVLMIRDYPEFDDGWQGCYILGDFYDLLSAKNSLMNEIKYRGGKYGGMVLGDGHKLVFEVDKWSEVIEKLK